MGDRIIIALFAFFMVYGFVRFFQDTIIYIGRLFKDGKDKDERITG